MWMSNSFPSGMFGIENTGHAKMKYVLTNNHLDHHVVLYDGFETHSSEKCKS